MAKVIHNTNALEIRSEEVQEIISHLPNGMVRWGLTVIFFVMSALLSVTWFIKYPDLLTGQRNNYHLPRSCQSCFANGWKNYFAKTRQRILPKK